ncbi:MAG: winged helix-turn-helix domain-containing protein [Clostridia bacterium]|nr:winged helix-turn-helix domain-containing protein [Clostridia bacterium]
MSVPKFFEFFPVVLSILSKSSVLSVAQIRKEAVSIMRLSDDDLAEMLPSGCQRTVDNRVNWAVTYLKNATLLASSMNSCTSQRF